MIAELGNYGLALALALSIFLAILPLVGAEKGNAKLMVLGRPLSWAMFLALTLSFGSLFYLFAVNDFSVQYVVNNSNSTLPLQYRYRQYGVHTKAHCYCGFGYCHSGR